MIAAAWKLAAAMAGQYSSTAQDMQRGKPTEIDALNGLVAERGDALGIATPVNRTLHALVKLREQEGSAGRTAPPSVT
jgi:2-dehydropantoate 2-reductase